jgi:hypothetical protein
VVSAQVSDERTPLAAARAARSRGWRPFPLDHPAHPHCIGAHQNVPCDGQRGKHPTGGWATQAASAPTDGMLHLWFSGELHNVGIACGPSGLVVLDEDELNALSKLAAKLGHTLPKTYRVRTARGWHYYFAAPTDRIIGNRSGALKHYGIDVRGGKGGGGYVVGAGSLHASGVIYEAEDPDAALAPLPDWIVEQIETVPDRPDGTRVGSADWTDEVRYGGREELVGQFERRVSEIRDRGNPFREQLYLAARDGWRLVHAGELDEVSMLGQLRDAVVRVWGHPPDDRDKRIVYGEAQPDAVSSPWEVVADLPPIGQAVAEQEEADEDKPTALELEIRSRERALYVDREARRRLALLDRARRPSIMSGLIDDLDSIEQPEMLLGSLIPELAVGFLAGRSGAYKSFLATSWACCIATGRPWLGDDRFKVTRSLKALYVAAEGAAGAGARIRAWEKVTGTSRAGKLQLYPRPIHLNDAGQAEELAEVVRDEGYEFLVVDTFRRSAPGAEENSPTEMGIVFDAVARIRDEHKCGVMFVDHTGHVNAGRPRGASSKGDDADYVLSADYDGNTREAQVQRWLSVTKLKDEESGQRWPIRLAPVEDHFPVVELGTVTASGLLPLVPRWFDIDAVPVPAEIVNLNGKGRAAARDIFRVLAYVNDQDGLTTAQIRKALNESSIEHTDSVYYAGLSMLKDEGVIVAGSSASKHALDGRFQAG